jgi:hypothetical protein
MKEDGMVKLSRRAGVLMLLCAVTSLPSSAKTMTRRVTFKPDVTVAGTVVKAGVYKAAFDEAREALKYMGSGSHFGKIVITFQR